MAALFASWWTAVSGFFVGTASVLQGDTGFFPLLGAAAVVLLVLGLALCAFWRVKQVVRLWPLVIVALLTPFAISLSNSILGWVGMLGAVLAGGIVLMVGTGIVAGSADRRLPIWITGASIMAFAVVTAAIGGAFDSLVA